MYLVRVPTVVLMVEPRLRIRRMQSPLRVRFVGLLIWSAVTMPWRVRSPLSGYLKSDGTSSCTLISDLGIGWDISGPKYIHREGEREMHQGLAAFNEEVD